MTNVVCRYQITLTDRPINRRAGSSALRPRGRFKTCPAARDAWSLARRLDRRDAASERLAIVVVGGGVAREGEDDVDVDDDAHARRRPFGVTD